MKYANPDIESSYRENDIGQTLYDLVLDLKPKKIIEFGVLGGYSTVAMAMALDKLGRGTIHAYDLWEKYPHKHSTMRNTAENIRAHGLEKYVQLHYGDLKTFEPEECGIFVLDISNDGDVVEYAYNKMREYCDYFVFEGGSMERDRVDWMKKYKKRPINDSGVTYTLLDDRFPSVSIVETRYGQTM